MTQISSIIARALEKFNISISNQGINSLTLHVLIAINRMETKNTIKFNYDDVRTMKLRSSPEYYVASYINREVSEHLHTSLPENELLYLTMHINGKQRIFGHENLQVKVTEESIIFYNKFLRNIYKMADVDLFDDDELRTSLMNHIVPFLNRVHNDMQITKSDLLNVRNEFPYAYELALYGLQIITDRGFSVTAAELSYFALHIALSLEKNKSPQDKYNVLIISDEVTSIFHILSFKLEKHFHEFINTVKFLDTRDLNNFDFGDYRLILNTTLKHIQCPSDILSVSSFMNDDDISAISKELERLHSSDTLFSLINPALYFCISAKNRDDLLKAQIDLIKKEIPLPEDFLNQVLKREAMSSTEYDNRIALPHPLTASEGISNFISIARLDKPILWNQKMVQLIFLVCTPASSKSTAWFFDKISRIICNDEAARTLIACTSYEDFAERFATIQ